MIGPRPIASLLLLVASIAHAQSAPQPDPVSTLRAQARLVVVDVVVTNHSGAAVHGLKRGDFTLLESAAPQTLTSFEEHSAPPTQATHLARPPQLPPGIFSNLIGTPAGAALNVVLLDALNTPTSDQPYVRQQLGEYVKHERPGTSVAVFGLTTQLHMLQGFTSDPEVLKAAVLRQAGTRGQSSPLLNDSLGTGAAQASLTDGMTDTGIPVPASMLSNVQTLDDLQQSFQTELRIRYTLHAMNQLAHFLAGLPGRKNLIWFSGSFPINILPDATGNADNPFVGIADLTPEYRETINLLARSRVAVYPSMRVACSSIRPPAPPSPAHATATARPRSVRTSRASSAPTPRSNRPCAPWRPTRAASPSSTRTTSPTRSRRRSTTVRATTPSSTSRPTRMTRAAFARSRCGWRSPATL